MTFCIKNYNCELVTVLQNTLEIFQNVNYNSKFHISFSSLLLARLKSVYSLIWGAQEIWGKGGGETLALL